MSAIAQSTESHILFELAGTTYAIRSSDVRHIEMVEQITTVPNAAKYVEGIFFSRGQVVPVLNLRTRFGFPKQAHTLRSRLIVANVRNRNVGLLVDGAREFMTIPTEAIHPATDAITGLSGKYLDGIATVAGRIIMVLNLQELLVGDETGQGLQPQAQQQVSAQPS